MKKNIFIKFFLVLFLGAFLVSISACNKAEEPQQTDDGGNVYPPMVPPEPEPQVVKEEISLPYSSLYKVTKAYHDSYYSDDYFKAKSFVYNQRLAIASLAVAMSSYPIKDEDTYGHTKELYTKLGFGRIIETFKKFWHTLSLPHVFAVVFQIWQVMGVYPAKSHIGIDAYPFQVRFIQLRRQHNIAVIVEGD